MFTQDAEDFVDIAAKDAAPDAPKSATKTPAATTGVDKPDRVQVEEYVALMNECRNCQELPPIWYKAKKDTKLTPGGVEHVKGEYHRLWAVLPEPVDVKPKIDPNQDVNPEVPF